jgi:acyl carrier protein
MSNTKNMDKSEFYQQLAAILDIEEVKPENVLKDYDQWDSLAILSVLALADSQYGITIRAGEIRQVVTAADLAALIEAKRK